MMAIGSILLTFMCISRLTFTYVLQPDDPGIPFRQQTAPVQERIINANLESIHSVEDAESENQGGVICVTRRQFYVNQEGKLMWCGTSELTEEEKPLEVPVQPQTSPHFIWTGLPTLGLKFRVGGRLPGATLFLNQHTDGGQETFKKKPVIIKPKPVVIKPIPIVIKPVHKPHKHPHSIHHHYKPCVHVIGQGLTAYHQPGLSSVTQEGGEHLTEKQFFSTPIQSGTYGHFDTPSLSILMPIQAQQILAKYVISNSKNPEKGSPASDDIVSDVLMEDQVMVRSDTLVNSDLLSSEPSQTVDDKKQVKGVNISTIPSFEINRNSTASNDNYARNDTDQHDKVDESKSFKLSPIVGDKKQLEAVNITANYFSDINQNSTTANNNSTFNYSDHAWTEKEPQVSNRTNHYDRIVNASDVLNMNATETLVGSITIEASSSEKPGEQEQPGDNVRGETISDYDVEPNAEKYEAAEDEGQSLDDSLSEGPNAMEDANEELDAARIRKIRGTPGIPIEILNDHQRPSSSILDRNTLLIIMSSLKEQYMKNAEPDQKKLIEDAFNRLHCSVRDMKKLDERPAGKKIDGSKRAALKLLAEKAQPLIEEPDYYSDATDDASAEPSFLELLNVATKHKVKQSLEAE